MSYKALIKQLKGLVPILKNHQITLTILNEANNHQVLQYDRPLRIPNWNCKTQTKKHCKKSKQVSNWLSVRPSGKVKIWPTFWPKNMAIFYAVCSAPFTRKISIKSVLKKKPRVNFINVLHSNLEKIDRYGANHTFCFKWDFKKVFCLSKRVITTEVVIGW